MIRILLADDNKTSLKFFSNLIPWEQYGFQLVSSAIDGKNAWDDFQKYLPEVVITDIQMPVMSGIELTQKISQIAPDTIVIFLSSFNDFTYAQSALRLKVFDYLLKHQTKKDELIEKLTAVKAHLAQKKVQNQILAVGELQEMFSQHLNGKVMVESKYLPTLSHQYDLFFMEQNHILQVIEKMMNQTTLEVQESDFKKTLYQISSSILAIIKISPFQYLVLSKTNEDPFQFCYQVKERLEQGLNRNFSILIISKSLSVQESVKAYSAISEFLTKLYFYPVSTVLDGVFLNKNKVENAQKDTLQLNFKIESDVSLILQQLENCYLDILHTKDYNSFYKLTDLFLSNILRYHQRTIDFSTGQIFSISDERSTTNWCDVFSIYQWLKQQYSNLYKIIPTQKTQVLSDVVIETIHYISQNYTDCNLSIEDISSSLKISTSTLNSIFKKETGYTVWKVLIKTRMVNAKQLLDQENCSITEIASLVGYNSLPYFSKVFKNAFNITAEEYRRQKTHEKKI